MRKAKLAKQVEVTTFIPCAWNVNVVNPQIAHYVGAVAYLRDPLPSVQVDCGARISGHHRVSNWRDLGVVKLCKTCMKLARK